MTALKVMVAGSWDEADPKLLATADYFGRWLALRGCWVLTGGGSGIAEACSNGATRTGGVSVSFHPGSKQTVSPTDGQHTLTVFTESGWDGRSLTAVKSCDVLVALGGHAGTLLEIAAAYLNGVPAIVLAGSSEMVERLGPFLLDGRHLDARGTCEINVASSMTVVESMIVTHIAGLTDGTVRG